MSDRTRSSVRTGAGSDGADASAETPAEDSSVTSTQSIPGTGTQRAQAAAAGVDGASQSPASQSSASLSSPSRAGASPSAGAQSAGGQSAAAQTAAAQPPVPPKPVAQAPASQVPVPPVPAPLTQSPPTGARGIPGMGPATGAGPVPGVGAGAATVGPRESRSRSAARSGGRGPRRARLQLRHIDTWSALKISLVLSIAMFCIWMVAVGILYGVLNGLGVFDTLNNLFGQVGGAKTGQSVKPVITLGVVFWGAGIIGAINVVLMTALCTVGTFIYNMCSDLVGGLEITLSERD